MQAGRARHAKHFLASTVERRPTPTFFLNGQPVDTSLGFEKLECTVHAALKAA